MSAPIQFNLTKDASAAPIAFALSKVQAFTIELFWNSRHDLDAHAIALTSGRLTAMEDVLSTYNPTLVLADNPSKNHIAGGKEPFMTPNGGLVHMGDKRTGLGVNSQEPDEVLKTANAKFGAHWDEIAIIVAMHPPHSGKFKDVDGARLVIKDDTGVELLEANLTHDFDEYDIVQMGSLLKNAGNGAWEFKPVASGINGDFNAVLSAFA